MRPYAASVAVMVDIGNVAASVSTCCVGINDVRQTASKCSVVKSVFARV